MSFRSCRIDHKRTTTMAICNVIECHPAWVWRSDYTEDTTASLHQYLKYFNSHNIHSRERSGSNTRLSALHRELRGRVSCTWKEEERSISCYHHRRPLALLEGKKLPESWSNSLGVPTQHTKRSRSESGSSNHSKPFCFLVIMGTIHSTRDSHDPHFAVKICSRRNMPREDLLTVWAYRGLA